MLFSLFGCLYIRRCGSHCFVSEKLGGSQAVLLQKHRMNSRGRQTYKEPGDICEHGERKGILLTSWSKHFDISHSNSECVTFRALLYYVLLKPSLISASAACHNCLSSSEEESNVKIHNHNSTSYFHFYGNSLDLITSYFQHGNALAQCVWTRETSQYKTESQLHPTPLCLSGTPTASQTFSPNFTVRPC